MPGVLRPDDLGWLTLVLSSFKCLKLNSIMLGVLRPNDLGWLSLILSSPLFKLKSNHDWSPQTK